MVPDPIFQLELHFLVIFAVGDDMVVVPIIGQNKGVLLLCEIDDERVIVIEVGYP